LLVARAHRADSQEFRMDRLLLPWPAIMDIFVQIAIVTTSVCAVAMVLRRAGKRDRGEQIEAGAVSQGWLAEFKIRRRDWPPGER